MTRLKVSAARVAPVRPLLLIDAGNTRIKWVWIAGGVDAKPALPEELDGISWQHAGAHVHDRLVELVEDWRDYHASGVVPPEIRINAVAGLILRGTLTARIARVFGGARVCIAASEDATAGLYNGYRDPTQLGIDRWIDAVGACHPWPDTAPLLVMADTATTLDIVTLDGLFAGGLILSGLTLMMHVLSRNTAQLPEVDVGYLSAGDVVTSPQVDNTQDAIVLGCVIVRAGVTAQAWRALQKQYPGPARCVLSSGARVALGPHLYMSFQIRDSFVLPGLQVLAHVRREGAAALAQPQSAGLQFPA